MQQFSVDGRSALLVVPREPAAGKPWIWRTEFFGVDPQADIALLGKGLHVAYIDAGGLCGAPVALDATVEIEVRGDERIRHIVEGQVVLEYTAPQLDNGTLLKQGTISLQSESHPIHFRKVELRELKD